MNDGHHTQTTAPTASPKWRAAAVIALVALVAFGAAYLGLRKSQLETRLTNLAVGALVGLEVYKEPRPAPTTAFVDRDGKAVTLRDFPGRYVLANFWATWCAPCIEEMPSLLRLHQTRGGERFQVIALSLDRKGFEVADPFLEKLGLSGLPVYSDRSNKLSLEVGASALPTTILIDPDGRIIARQVGPVAWDSDEVKRMVDLLLSDFDD